jgi:hypothetical protein
MMLEVGETNGSTSGFRVMADVTKVALTAAGLKEDVSAYQSELSDFVPNQFELTPTNLQTSNCASSSRC